MIFGIPTPKFWGILGSQTSNFGISGIPNPEFWGFLGILGSQTPNFGNFVVILGYFGVSLTASSWKASRSLELFLLRETSLSELLFGEKSGNLGKIGNFGVRGKGEGKKFGNFGVREWEFQAGFPENSGFGVEFGGKNSGFGSGKRGGKKIRKFWGQGRKLGLNSPKIQHLEKKTGDLEEKNSGFGGKIGNFGVKE